MHTVIKRAHRPTLRKYTVRSETKLTRSLIMSTITDSPFSIKMNPVWNDQVKVGRGHNDLGAFHRAIKVAEHLIGTGQWNGQGLIIIHDPYSTYNKLDFYRQPMEPGVDFEYADDSIYRGSGPVEEAR